jgi:hypothetical protein
MAAARIVSVTPSGSACRNATHPPTVPCCRSPCETHLHRTAQCLLLADSNRHADNVCNIVVPLL